MQPFRDFVAQARLLDLGFVGYPFTWRNRRDEGFIQERLDRALATNNWVQCYQHAVVKHVVLEGSDRVMLILSTNVDIPRQRRRFMFNPLWNQEEKYAEVVRKCWVPVPGNNPAHRLVQNLRQVKHGLLVWQKKEGRNEQNEICRLKEVIREAYQQPVFDGRRIKEWEMELTKAIKKEEVYWCTKSRVQWLREGDKNTRFFSCANPETKKTEYYSWVGTGG